MNGAWL
jgi:hypothetical protein